MLCAFQGAAEGASAGRGGSSCDRCASGGGKDLGFSVVDAEAKGLAFGAHQFKAWLNVFWSQDWGAVIKEGHGEAFSAPSVVAWLVLFCAGCCSCFQHWFELFKQMEYVRQEKRGPRGHPWQWPSIWRKHSMDPWSSMKKHWMMSS